MILNIQVLRGLAALAVVFYHTDFRLNGNVHTDFQGVSIFFIISGFIMTYIIHNNADQFFTRRIIRIVPLYWILTLTAFVLFNIVIPGLWHISRYPGLLKEALKIENLLILAKSFFFIPYQGAAAFGFPYLGVGWTLNLEMFFYLVLAFMLLFSKKWAPVSACLILIGIKIINFVTEDSLPILKFYGHAYTTFFILGVFSYYLWTVLNKSKIINKQVVIVPIGVITTSCFLALNAGYFGDYNVYLSYFMPFSLVLIALLLYSTYIQWTWKPVLILGDASYALYLCHTVWLEMQTSLANQIPILNFKHSLIGVIVALFISCLVAVFIHNKIEKPVIEMLRQKIFTERLDFRSKLIKLLGEQLGNF